MTEQLDLSTLSEPELVALRDLLDQLIPLVAACEQPGGGGCFAVPRPRGGRSHHHDFNRGSTMTFEARPARRIVHCDDAPVSTCETEAEAAARVARAVPAGSPFTWDERELARSALGDLPEAARAEFLADLLCELRGPDARYALAIARNRITTHMHDLITAEYDAEAAKMPGQDIAELARRSV